MRVTQYHSRSRSRSGRQPARIRTWTKSCLLCDFAGPSDESVLAVCEVQPCQDRAGMVLKKSRYHAFGRQVPDSVP